MTYEQDRERLAEITIELDPASREMVTALWGEPYADEMDRELQHSLRRMLGLED